MSNECRITGVKRLKDDRLDFLIQIPNKDAKWVSESALPNEALEIFLTNLKSRIEELTSNMNHKGFHAKRTITNSEKQVIKKAEVKEIVQKDKTTLVKKPKEAVVEEKEKDKADLGLKIKYRRPEKTSSLFGNASGDESGMETERTCGNDTEPEDFMQFVAKMKKPKKAIRFNPKGKRYPLIAVEIPIKKNFKLNPRIQVKKSRITSSSSSSDIEKQTKHKPAYSSIEIDHALTSSFVIPSQSTIIEVEKPKIDISEFFEFPEDEKTENQSDKDQSRKGNHTKLESDGESLKRRAKRSNIIFFD